MIVEQKKSSADKAFGVLMALGSLGMSAPSGVRLSDLVANLGYPRPTFIGCSWI